MPDVNPGIGAAGSAAGAAYRNPSVGAASIGGLTAGSSFDVNTKGLQDLSAKIRLVTTDIGSLISQLDKLEKKATSVGNAFDKAFSKTGGPGKGGSRTTTTAPVSGGPQPSGGLGGLGATRALTLGAVGEIGSSWAGSINSGMQKIQAGGMPIDLQARQASAVFGGAQGQGFGGANVSGYTAISNMGQADLGGAIAHLQANPLLFAGQGSRKQAGITAFMNQMQKLNPLMGASGAAQFANTLTTGSALQQIQRYSGASGGALLRPMNVSNPGGINNPTQVLRTLLKTVTGNAPGLTGNANQLKRFGGNAQDWAMINQNFGQGTAMNLSPQELISLRQFASAGGNLTQADKNVAGSVAGTSLSRSTATTKTKQDVFESTANLQNWTNDFMTSVQKITDLEVKAHPILVTLVAGFAGAGAGALKLAATFLEANAMMKGVGGLSGGKGVLGKVKSIFSKGGAEAGGVGAGEVAAGVGGGAATGAEVGLGAVALPLGIAAGLAFGGIKYGTNHPALGPTGLPSLNTAAAKKEFKGGLKGLPKGNVNVPKISSNFTNAVRDWANQSDPQLAAALQKYDTPQGDPMSWMGDSPTGSTSTAGLTPTMAKRVSAMQSANPSIKISSGHRTAQQQSNLYALKGGKGVAKPGHSAHQTGQAADVGPPSQFGWIAKNASKFGLARPAPKSEPWHLQAMGDPVSSGSTVTGAQVVSQAESWIGTPYVYGGQGTAPGQGVDCSRFVQEVYASVGISLPRTSYEQMNVGSTVKDIGSAQPGDLIFYGGGEHVTIYIGNNQLIHAPETGEVIRIQTVWDGITVIKRVASGGAGTAAAAAAAGSTSGTSSSSSHGTNVGLANVFNKSLSNSPALGGGSGVSSGTGQGAPSKSGGGGGGSANKAAGQAAPASGGSAAVVSAVKAVTSDKNVQIAMLMGAQLESGQDPTSNGQNVSYGAWQIEPSANPVTQAQAEDVNFAAKYMVGRYSGGVQQEWGGQKGTITEQAAGNAAYDAERPAESYFQSQPSNVGPAYALAVSEVGDPVGASVFGSGSGSGAGVGMSGQLGGDTHNHFHMPIQLAGQATQQDAQNLVQMVFQMIDQKSQNDRLANT